MNRYFLGGSTMLSCFDLDNLRGDIDDSYIDAPHGSHCFHTKRGEVTDELGYTSNRATQHIVGKSKNYRSNNRRRFWRKDSSISKILKPKKGTSLVEVVVAMLILTILIIGGHHHFVYGRGQIALQGHYRVAAQLAAQKLEELKASNYNDIVEGPTEETLSIGDLSCSRSTDTNDVGLYKQINVTVHWSQLGKDRNVSLDTFMAPK